MFNFSKTYFKFKGLARGCCKDGAELAGRVQVADSQPAC